jgi:hypothetical protein
MSAPTALVRIGRSAISRRPARITLVISVHSEDCARMLGTFLLVKTACLVVAGLSSLSLVLIGVGNIWWKVRSFPFPHYVEKTELLSIFSQDFLTGSCV